MTSETAAAQPGLESGEPALFPSDALLDKRQQASNNDIYIVQLKADPVIAYDGGIKGYAATKPGKGGKLNPNSAHVKKYAAYLEAQQDEAIQSVGGEKVYSYRYGLNGFAARMTAADAQALKLRSDVVTVWKDEIRQLHTNTSPAYIALTAGGEAWSKGLTGEDVVIGIIDTGVWPEHPSFADVATPKKGNKGPAIPYGPAPDGFTASGCDFGNTAANSLDAPASCSNKLLAARCYNLGFSSASDPNNPCGGDGALTIPTEFQSARDNDGHGSHVGSTAGGNFGVPASIQGELIGNVSGIAPRARISAYKVCWNGSNPPPPFGGGCASSDSAAAIDQAVIDGVDVINFSIGGASTRFAGPDDIAFLFAADAGVWVATSNGNAGPGAQTTGTPAGVPWLTAVGANQDDGVFGLAVTVNTPASIAGDKEALEGVSPVSLSDTGVISGDVTLVSDNLACGPIAPITGIALASRGACSFSTKYNNAAAAGAEAIIVFNDGADSTRVDPIVMSAPGTTIPGVMVGFFDGVAMAGETGVTATLDPNNLVSRVNRVAGFSSRGPNGGMPDVIKPDISAPGVSILAAHTPIPNDGQPPGELFQIISGTSMASPHVAGSFALLKEAHPDWTPAQARSALMTTARQGLLKTFGDDAANAFDIGAGEILPSDAEDPGLSYDAGFLDYLAALCGEPAQAGIVTQGTCDFLESVGFSLDPSDLNLPSIGIAELAGSQTVTRTVTSVANNQGNKTFTVSVDAPPGIEVSVSPSSVTVRNGESATYQVTFTATEAAVLDEWAFGSLTWGHAGEYSARSPIAVRPVALAAPSGVAGSGTDGSLSYNVDFGYSGDFQVSMDGLTEGEGQPDVVADGGFTLHFFVVPPGTTLARFSLFDDEIGAQNDLDLQIQGPDTAGFPFVCFSGTPTSEEQCDLVNPAPGLYAAFVIDFASDPGPTPYTLWNFNSDGTDVGNSTLSAPASAVVGTSGQIDLSWFGLTPGTRALGIIGYSDGVGSIGPQTEVMINTQ
jgi:subtilisin family serine protease